MKRKLLAFLTIVFAIVAVISTGMVISFVVESRMSARAYAELAQFANFEGMPEVDFEALREINPNIVAWIHLEGTPISYPVVQGQDNEFYLNHLFDGTRNAAGTLFVDSRNAPDFTDRNTIIYGHNMRDGSMFAVLEEFSSQEFFEQNSRMFLLTPEGSYLIYLFAGYRANVHANSWQRSFADADEFEKWIREAKRQSDFTSEVEVTESDLVVTLSTCSYAFYNARYVVVGVLRRI